MSMKCPSLSLLSSFIWSLFCLIRRVIGTGFLFHLHEVLFPSYYSEAVSAFEDEVCFMSRQKEGPCFLIQAASLCLISKLRPLIFTVIIERCVFILVICWYCVFLDFAWFSVYFFPWALKWALRKALTLHFSLMYSFQYSL